MKKSILLLLACCSLKAQFLLKGIVIDKDTKAPVSYAYCGVIGKSMGSIANEHGRFELKLGDGNLSDSIRFYAIGYGSLTQSIRDMMNRHENIFFLTQGPEQLEEVTVRGKKMKTDEFGTHEFSEKNCTGFIKNESGWKGSQAAVLIANTKKRMVNLDEFLFYIVQNRYSDSLRFRLMFYGVSEKKYPKQITLNKRPILFKIATKSGVFVLDLKSYNLKTDKDFFVSLECLTDEVDITKFCFTGAIEVPSFVKPSPFEAWHKTRGGGAEFQIKVSWEKE